MIKYKFKDYKRLQEFMERWKHCIDSWSISESKEEYYTNILGPKGFFHYPITVYTLHYIIKKLS